MMPMRNAMPYLHDCIASIREQSYENWELLLVDDHSEDDSYAIANQIGADEPRMIVRRLEATERGIIAALRQAYALSSGTYITRMDADDIMSPTKLQRLAHLLQWKGIGHVAVGAVRYFAKDGIGQGYAKYAKWLNRLTGSSVNYTEIYRECVIPSPCWMMHRTDFEEIGGFEGDRYPEDYDLCFRMKRHHKQVIGTEEVLHLWRDHSARASRNDSNYADNRFLTLKIDYFLCDDRVEAKTLLLWGAGAKGKWIAQELISRKIAFRWLTNNLNKIGHIIYGQHVESDIIIGQFDCPQIIVAISSPDAREEAIRRLDGFGYNIGDDYFPFC